MQRDAPFFGYLAPLTASDQIFPVNSRSGGQGPLLRILGVTAYGELVTPVSVFCFLDKKMLVEQTKLQGVLILTPKRHGDVRGFFSESWNAARMAEHGLTPVFVQDNHSYSEARGTLRGLHFQAPPHAQGKLVRCSRGALFDVAVDIRRGSPGYGQWVGVELSFDNGRQLWIPPGFAHGFVTLTEGAEVCYKCTDYYAPSADGGVRWDSCGIDWPLGAEPMLSDKDATAPALDAFESPFIYER